MLAETLGENLVDLYLFGSKARGDSHVDSDIDLLIILCHLDANSRWLARSVAANCSLEYDVLFNTHLYEKGRWDAIVAQRDTLWREVQRDGVPLRDLLTQPVVERF
ncbi:MAG: nucleotidyltransferase domain-containing protein [Anaerolineae bacterium]|nr:nucleotidyltransferase domain-containing protein [Anaerolineae bacterium]